MHNAAEQAVGCIAWLGFFSKRLRIDLAAGYRFTPHTQLKVEYSLQHETTGPRDSNHLFAAQFTVCF